MNVLRTLYYETKLFYIVILTSMDDYVGYKMSLGFQQPNEKR